ncbi:hypothetical protein SAPIO_CDS7139 [Scedosporium apiospermum]|uniref:Peptidase S1 domain-containing protein n=1 Tax=Pseudallescheria apiosperma TaxID=563466 RepID=A0A084G171_PSEDA|nr:uncharacterized protein SAPIO_CDS7139 [Scedosporium apiospermum]KEZ41083.1 hypothetical protein SAPIO_CDS7139 [Scedosporium apiospermum]
MSAIYTQFAVEFIEKAEEVLAAYEIEGNDDCDVEIDFVTRSVLGLPHTAKPTLTIVAPWEESKKHSWEAVVSAVKSYIDNRLADSTFDDHPGPIDVCVEMMAPELTRRKFLGPVEDNANLESDWPAIQDKVYSILESFSQTRGFYVSLDYDADEVSWPPVAREIQAYLDGLEHGLVVHMEHNILKGFAFELLEPRNSHRGLLIPDDYKKGVGLGGDISASTYLTRDDQMRCNPILGTLGCYIEVKTRSSSEWVRLGLTNYHVIRPCLEGFKLTAASGTEPFPHGGITAPGGGTIDSSLTASAIADPVRESQLWRADMSGFTPKTVPESLPLESPARIKHNYTVHDDASIIQEESMMPLSAITSDADQTEKMAEMRATRNGTLRPQLDASLWKMRCGQKVFKVGARTNATVGYYSRYKPKCTLDHDKYMKVKPSSEHVIIGHLFGDGSPQAFADNGDSGAVVFDTFGQMVGLLLTGQAPQGTRGQGYALVTPIEEVFEDIKAMSNGEITDIRVSNW